MPQKLVTPAPRPQLDGYLAPPPAVNVNAVRAWLALFAATVLVSLPSIAAAQSSDVLGLLPELDVRAKGWAQLLNAREMLDFGLAVIEACVLTLIVSLHPVNLADRHTRADFDRPRTFFIHMLIGLTVGFLVLHHGYIIGFVIFGIGGLLRFRSESTSAQDTTRLIIATLFGLCIGLDLPVIAFFAALTGWVALYLFSQRIKVSVEVKFGEKKNIQQCTERLIALLDERGFKTLGHSKAKFKPIVSFVLEGERGNQRSALIREMTDIQSQKLAPVEEWHVE